MQSPKVFIALICIISLISPSFCQLGADCCQKDWEIVMEPFVKSIHSQPSTSPEVTKRVEVFRDSFEAYLNEAPIHGICQGLPVYKCGATNKCECSTEVAVDEAAEKCLTGATPEFCQTNPNVALCSKVFCHARLQACGRDTGTGTGSPPGLGLDPSSSNSLFGSPKTLNWLIVGVNIAIARLLK